MKETEIGTDLAKAKAILINGGLVAVPTETVYGLAANALDPAAVVKIFEAKNRPTFDPLIVHISTIKELYKYTSQINIQLSEIAKVFWPGPLTILAPKKEIIPDIVCSGLENVAIRVPKHPLTLALLSALDFPVAAPSANPFGYVSPTTAQHVYDQLKGKVDYILDGGACEVGVESTIISVENGELVVYRKGGITIPQLKSVFSGVVKVNDFSDSNPTAPGMLKKHYSPNKEIQLLSSHTLVTESKEKVGFLRFNSPVSGFRNQFILSEKSNLEEAAHRLFQGLRYLDSLPIEKIYLEFVPEEGLGIAINDRLKRVLAL